MNELRPCAPLSLKHVLAQELVKGLQFLCDSLLRYNTTRLLRENMSGLSLSLCRPFVEVAYPHCATCFGRCFPGGASLIMDAKNLYDGVSRLLAALSTRELPKSVKNRGAKSMAENGDAPMVELGRTSETKEAEAINADEKEKKSPISQTDEADTDLENPA